MRSKLQRSFGLSTCESEVLVEKLKVCGEVASFCEGFAVGCALGVLWSLRGSDRLIARSIVAEEGVVRRSL